jgi:hypothetical protein
MQEKRTNKKSNKTSNGNSVGSFGSLLSESSQYQEIMDKFKSIVNSRVDKFYDDRGADGEMYAYAIAVNQVRNKAKESPAEEEPKPEESKPEEPMDKEQKLKEMIQAALSKPLNEKKKSFPDLTGDGKVTQADILKARGVELDEDLDLGHQDDEPHMIKAELAQIGEYAMELYKMIDNFEGPQEVDFPAWWQSKITTAKNMISGAKHYLEFELKEPQIDAMVGIASEEDVIDEEMTPQKSQKIGMPFKDIAEAVLAKIKESKK